MRRPIRFFYDVVCPYSYLESHAVEAAEDTRGVVVEWLPLELRPFREAFVFAAVIVVLLARPQGLFRSREARERV